MNSSRRRSLAWLTATAAVALSRQASAFSLMPIAKRIMPKRSKFSRLFSSSPSASAAQEQEPDPAALEALCRERNLDLDNIKNARDLASLRDSPVEPNKLFRTGRVGNASEKDCDLLLERLQIRTLIDLRSPTELKEEHEALLTAPIFLDFTNLVWSQRRDGKSCVTELPAGVSPVQRRKRQPKEKSKRKQKIKKELKNVLEQNAVATATELETVLDVEDEDDEDDSVVSMRHASALDGMDEAVDTVVDDEELCDFDCEDDDAAVSVSHRKERHFVSLMNEFKYVRGTVSKLRKRDLTKALLKSPGAVVSKRMRDSLKEPFLNKINDGGLIMLNELLLKFGAPGIKYVLEVCADETRHPVAFYCTAGKDRTGMIAAIILSLCGADPDDIVEDYGLSANVYAEMGDNQAMVGALSQRNLDPKTFLGAPPQVMRDTLAAIDERYGSVEGYCDAIGFDETQRERLRNACKKKKSAA